MELLHMHGTSVFVLAQTTKAKTETEWIHHCLPAGMLSILL